MCRSKILSAILAMVILTAESSRADDRMFVVFAGCAGRYSAEMEHAWLLNQGHADAMADLRETFLSLLDAALPTGQERTSLHHRIDVKFAHAALLTLATFNQDDNRSQAARTMADAHLASCQHLLLGG